MNVIDSAACAEYSESRGWCILWKGYVAKAEIGAGPRVHNCPQFRTLGVTPSSQLRPSLRELRAELSANDTMVNWQKHNKFYQLNGKGFRKPTSNVWLLPQYKRPFLDFPNMLTPKDKKIDRSYLTAPDQNSNTIISNVRLKTKSLRFAVKSCCV